MCGPEPGANVIDIRTRISPTQWALRIGPTRHAFFTVRLADGLRVVDGGSVVDSEGRSGGAAISGERVRRGSTRAGLRHGGRQDCGHSRLPAGLHGGQSLGRR